MDEFEGIPTWGLAQYAFKLTPRHEWQDWEATSDRADSHPDSRLRAFVLEQIAEYGGSLADFNERRS
jgi:hypothetical protein